MRSEEITMTDFVRVALPNGHEATFSRDYAESEDLEVLDGVAATNSRGVPLPATRRNGRPLKPRTTVEKEAAKKAETQSDPGPSDNTTDDGVAVKPEEASE
jgi:hypothetical protein